MPDLTACPPWSEIRVLFLWPTGCDEVHMKPSSLLRSSAVWLCMPPLAILPGANRHFAPASGGGSDPDDPESADFERFFELSSDPMLVLDAGHTILTANPSAARLFAVSREKL